MNKTCFILAGGTGGHVFPGIAVATALRELGWNVHWLGNEDKMEARVVPQQGFAFHSIRMSGLRGRGVTQKLRALVQAFSATLQVLKLLREMRPHLVLGFGGYVSGPGGVAAKILRIPLVIHEQNAVAGMANRWLGRIANRILLGFSSARTSFPFSSDCVVVGNPVRQDILYLPAKSKMSEALKLLIVGGSLGARVFNEKLPPLLGSLPNLAIWHQTGRADHEKVLGSYQQIPHQARVDAFIEDMASAYEWADVVICRAGALTVAEIAAAGRAAIFVPYPHAVDDHQRKNAEFMVTQGAAVLLDQEKLNEQLVTLIKAWYSEPSLWIAMGMAAKKIGNTDATANVVAHCLQIAGE